MLQYYLPAINRRFQSTNHRRRRLCGVCLRPLLWQLEQLWRTPRALHQLSCSLRSSLTGQSPSILLPAVVVLDPSLFLPTAHPEKSSEACGVSAMGPARKSLRKPSRKPSRKLPANTPRGKSQWNLLSETPGGAYSQNFLVKPLAETPGSLAEEGAATSLTYREKDERKHAPTLQETQNVRPDWTPRTKTASTFPRYRKVD